MQPKCKDMMLPIIFTNLSLVEMYDELSNAYDEGFVFILKYLQL